MFTQYFLNFLTTFGKTPQVKEHPLSYYPSFSFSNLPPRRGLLSATTSPHSPTPQPQQRSAHIFFITRNYSDSAAATRASRGYFDYNYSLQW